MVRGTQSAKDFMQPNRLSPVVIAAALNACALEPESLNSERIARRFGSYGIEVLSHSAGVRRTSLYSLAEEQKICRTYAVVRFVDADTPRVAAAHAEILAGQSIGATFKSSGWTIGKISLHTGSLLIEDLRHPIARLMALERATELGVHAYQLVLQQDTQTIEYATIVETHHPEYLGVKDLEKLYGENIQQKLNSQDAGNLSTLIMDMD
jgi:hypothetical protein